jgi:hypothetical protein
MPTVDDIDELVELADESRDLYLRYSQSPAADQSEGSSFAYEASES